MTSTPNDAPAEENFSPRYSWFRKHDVSPVFFLALGVAAASLGCLLYLGVDWRIALYELARLFIINSDTTLGQEAAGRGAEVARFAMWVFRFAAPLLTASAVYRFAKELGFGNRIPWHWPRDPTDYAVVAGIGKHGMEVCNGLHENGVRIVAIERDPDNPNLEELEQRKDTKVVVGDATSPSILRRARAGEARRVYAVSGDDVANINIATSVADELASTSRYERGSFMDFVRTLTSIPWLAWQILLRGYDNQVAAKRPWYERVLGFPADVLKVLPYGGHPASSNETKIYAHAREDLFESIEQSNLGNFSDVERLDLYEIGAEDLVDGDFYGELKAEHDLVSEDELMVVAGFGRFGEELLKQMQVQSEGEGLKLGGCIVIDRDPEAFSYYRGDLPARVSNVSKVVRELKETFEVHTSALSPETNETLVEDDGHRHLMITHDIMDDEVFDLIGTFLEHGDIERVNFTICTDDDVGNVHFAARASQELARNDLCREESIQVVTRMFREPDFADPDASEHVDMFQVDRLVRERFYSEYW